MSVVVYTVLFIAFTAEVGCFFFIAVWLNDSKISTNCKVASALTYYSFLWRAV